MHLQDFSAEAIQKMLTEIIQELQVETPAYARATVEIQPLQPCSADPTLFRQVWQNLLSNAFKFSSTVPEPHITIGSFEALDGAGYFVRDNGVGFDPAYSSKLFTPFQRLHGDAFPGYGAGLAIVYRVIQRHNGRIWAESAPGIGTTFYFTIAKDIPDAAPQA
jgi:light-regulated signal transduction histidine kinase (bacteriophytochrome)